MLAAQVSKLIRCDRCREAVGLLRPGTGVTVNQTVMRIGDDTFYCSSCAEVITGAVVPSCPCCDDASLPPGTA